MDQQTRVAGTYIFAILLFMIAFMFFCFGVGLMFSFPDILALGGLASLAFAGIFIYSGVKNLNDAKNFDRDAAIQIKASANAFKNTTTSNIDSRTEIPITNEISILAHWHYSKREWDAFMKWESSERKTSITIEAVVIIVLGSIILRISRNAGWVEAFLISSGVAVIYWLGKSYIAKNAIGKAENNQVIITDRSVIINGKVNSFSDNLYWLKKVELIQGSDIDVLQFVYAWNTRKGPTSEEIRVPIPENKIEEAKELIQRY